MYEQFLPTAPLDGWCALHYVNTESELQRALVSCSDSADWTVGGCGLCPCPYEVHVISCHSLLIHGDRVSERI